MKRGAGMHRRAQEQGRVDHDKVWARLRQRTIFASKDGEKCKDAVDESARVGHEDSLVVHLQHLHMVLQKGVFGERWRKATFYCIDRQCEKPQRTHARTYALRVIETTFGCRAVQLRGAAQRWQQHEPFIKMQQGTTPYRGEYPGGTVCAPRNADSSEYIPKHATTWMKKKNKKRAMRESASGKSAWHFCTAGKQLFRWHVDGACAHIYTHVHGHTGAYADTHSPDDLNNTHTHTFSQVPNSHIDSCFSLSLLIS